jgi:type IV secretory pathway component VirB8
VAGGNYTKKYTIQNQKHYTKTIQKKNHKLIPIILTQLPNTYGMDVDIMVEAKAKELAILPFIK